uniref:Phospholipid-transporting ATPase ID n=1 Tax=Oryzias sinensis TaxID=183150 RepID=A0A8C8DFT4_9TELE
MKKKFKKKYEIKNEVCGILASWSHFLFVMAGGRNKPAALSPPASPPDQPSSDSISFFMLTGRIPVPRLCSETWMNVQVGDIIKLENNQFVTADLLLLSSSEPLNLVYVETAELDGETNLKVRQALPVTGELGEDIGKLADFNGEVRCEPPNNRLDRFTGTLTFAGQKYSLDNEKILLRGCTLRNTEWCFGLVLFAGPETKLMQNCGRSTFKRTSIDRLMNILVLCIFGFLAFMCFVLAIGNYIWETNEGSGFTVFLPREDGVSAGFSTFLTFWSYIIILNTVVPISLYVRFVGFSPSDLGVELT